MKRAHDTESKSITESGVGSIFSNIPSDIWCLIIGYFDSCDAFNSFALVSKECALLILNKYKLTSWIQQYFDENYVIEVKSFILPETPRIDVTPMEGWSNWIIYLKLEARNIAFYRGYQQIIDEQIKLYDLDHPKMSWEEDYLPNWYGSTCVNQVTCQTYYLDNIPYDFTKYAQTEGYDMINRIILYGTLTGIINLMKNHESNISLSLVIICCLQEDLITPDYDHVRADILDWVLSDAIVAKMQFWQSLYKEHHCVIPKSTEFPGKINWKTGSDSIIAFIYSLTKNAMVAFYPNNAIIKKLIMNDQWGVLFVLRKRWRMLHDWIDYYSKHDDDDDEFRYDGHRASWSKVIKWNISQTEYFAAILNEIPQELLKDI